MTSQRTKPYVRRWTGYAKWSDGTVEEVDVDAETLFQATDKVRAELAGNYRPGWTLVKVVVRFGFYT